MGIDFLSRTNSQASSLVPRCLVLPARFPRRVEYSETIIPNVRKNNTIELVLFFNDLGCYKLSFDCDGKAYYLLFQLKSDFLHSTKVLHNTHQEKRAGPLMNYSLPNIISKDQITTFGCHQKPLLLVTLSFLSSTI